MFERFADSAREAVHEAQREARRLGAPAVGTEHLLIALAGRTPLLRRPPEYLDVQAGPAVQMRPPARVTAEELRAALAAHDPDTDALAAIGISLPEVKRAVEEAFGPDAFACEDGRLPFRAEAKRALELSLREAQSLGMRRIDPQVLLLGLLYEPSGATELLSRVGADPTELYTWTRESLRSLSGAARR